MVPPPQALLQPADRRTRHAAIGILVPPWAYKALTYPGKVLKHAKHRIRISVEPSPHGEDRTLNRPIVLADRAVLPIPIVMLMHQPRFDEGRCSIQAIEPHGFPPITDANRIRWPC